MFRIHQNENFKIPGLPPAKRPPTRPKKQEEVVQNSTWHTRQIVNDKYKDDSTSIEDDILSIGA